MSRKITILTGSVDSGKTTFVKNLINDLRKQKKSLCGIYSDAVISGSRKIGYDIVSISTGDSRKLCRERSGEIQSGQLKFEFNQDGVNFGLNVLNHAMHNQCDYLVIDEAGPLELNEKGWASVLGNILKGFPNNIIVVVRDYLVDEFMEKWHLKETNIFNINNEKEDQIIDKLFSAK